LKVWIIDRWWGADPVTKKKTVKKANCGSGARWQVSHYAEQADGTRKLAAKNFDRLIDAEAFRTKTEHELREGSYRSPEFAKKTFADAAVAWLDGRKRPNGASLFRYRDALDIWALPTWSRRTLGSILRTDIEAWVTQLIAGTAKHAEGRRVRGSGLSPAGLTAVWVPFKASLANAVDLGWINSNPARGVELPKVRVPDKVFLSYPEVEDLVTAAREVTGRAADAMMIELMAFAGLRPGEVVALQVQHVDLPSRRIKIRRTATIDIHGSAIFGEPKHGERREVPIAPHLVPELERLIDGKPGTSPLVDSARGQFINIHNWRGRVWCRAVDAAGLGGRCLSPKALRHTTASMAIAAGADVKVVQRMLGHADASMTLNTYADLWPDRLDEVALAMSQQRTKALAEWPTLNRLASTGP
jgi:integrase